LREGDFLLAIQQGDRTHLPEIKAEGVIGPLADFFFEEFLGRTHLLGGNLLVFVFIVFVEVDDFRFGWCGGRRFRRRFRSAVDF
jgi:hypothetical protein